MLSGFSNADRTVAMSPFIDKYDWDSQKIE